MTEIRHQEEISITFTKKQWGFLKLLEEQGVITSKKDYLISIVKENLDSNLFDLDTLDSNLLS